MLLSQEFSCDRDAHFLRFHRQTMNLFRNTTTDFPVPLSPIRFVAHIITLLPLMPSSVISTPVLPPSHPSFYSPRRPVGQHLEIEWLAKIPGKSQITPHKPVVHTTKNLGNWM